MPRKPLLSALALAAALAAPRPAAACTSILVARGASSDGSTFITYAADSHELYGELAHAPAGKHPPGAMRDVYEWDTGKFLGRIRQAPVTYAVVGQMNEHQVSLAETTFGGRKELVDPKGIIDYGSLMFLALERARTAREAIQVMTDLVAEYGYASEGESFSIADPKEVWILEMVGKGKDRRGAVWVARRLPDGTVSAHANHPRIRTFPRDDPKSTLYARDVVSFAREKGWFTGKDEEFSFADVYAPLTFSALRACEARVWNVFRRVAPSLDLSADHATGKAGGPRLPIWVKPDRPLSARDVMELMRDHFEGTELDLSKGVGAGPFALPYRWRPLTWQVDGKRYVNERAISTQQTGYSFVAQARASLPAPIGGVLWFGLDDTFSTVYVPQYCGNWRVPATFGAGAGSFDRFSWDSAFWVFNAVSNWAYGNRYWDVMRDVQKVQGELEGGFFSRQADLEKAALALHAQSPALARDYLTAYSAEQGDLVTARWRKLWESLVVKYLDGNVRDEKGKVTHPDYPEAWRRRMAQDRGEAIEVRPLPGEPPEEE
ncbi:MAG TPA: C69 family dipeptidase [Anaeromyxobacteraceae bacterium]|nr:C69 family dipeptidase [Anaeromyxobacteraceae bacterium]